MNVRQRPPLAFLALLLALLLLGAGQRAAASVTPLTLEEIVAISDEVHTVKVESTETFFYKGKIFTKAHLEVLESFKGDLTGKTEVSYPGGEYRMLGMHAETGMEAVRPGDHAVLFMSYPVRRMPAEARAQFDAASPMVSAPQLVGGFQGRFELKVFPNLVPADSPAPRETLLQTATVRRRTSGAARRADGTLETLTYPQFADAIRKLVAEERNLRSQGRAAAKKIAGIRGEFYVPQRREDNTVARACDPLPKIAYVSREELDEIKRQAALAAEQARARREELEARSREAAEQSAQQTTQDNNP